VPTPYAASTTCAAVASGEAGTPAGRSAVRSASARVTTAPTTGFARSRARSISITTCAPCGSIASMRSDGVAGAIGATERGAELPPHATVTSSATM
jgi:hypothetical protein